MIAPRSGQIARPSSPRPAEGFHAPPTTLDRPSALGKTPAVSGWVFGLFDTLGAAGVGLLIFLDNFFPPIPSEVVLPLAGFRARTGDIDPVLVWPAATIGAVAGSLVVYYLGVWLGYDRLYALAGRRWFVLASRRDLERGRRLFDRHGGKMVLIGRCIPFVRSVISIPAGIAGMSVRRFLVLTTIGSGIWNALLIGLGWYLGENWTVVEDWSGPAGIAVAALAVAGIGVLVVRRSRSGRTAGADGTRHRRGDDPNGDHHGDHLY